MFFIILSCSYNILAIYVCFKKYNKNNTYTYIISGKQKVINLLNLIHRVSSLSITKPNAESKHNRYMIDTFYKI